jgi:hypothetical protein
VSRFLLFQYGYLLVLFFAQLLWLDLPLNQSSKNRHPCFVPDVRKKLSVFTLHMFAVGFSCIAFIMLRKFPSLPSFLFFNHKKVFVNFSYNNLHDQGFPSFFFFGPGAWTQGLPTLWTTPPALLFVKGVFQDRISQTVCLGWLWATILLISASWVARITGVSHQCLAH